MSGEFDEEQESATLDAFLESRRGLVGGIVADMAAKGVGEDAFDGLVHDAAENVSAEASDWGSRINNEGIERQVAFVLQENGDVDGQALLTKAADEWLAENAPKPA